MDIVTFTIYGHPPPPQAACGDDDALRDLGAAATKVTEALNSLIQQIKEGVGVGDGGQYDEAVDAILAATQRLFRLGRRPLPLTLTPLHSPHTFTAHAHLYTPSYIHTHAHVPSHPQPSHPHTCTPSHSHTCTPSHSHSSMGNAQEMVKQAKILAEATSALVNAIKLEADAETDPDARRRLLDAAKSLADATSKMVEAAKGAARNPHDEQAQEALRRAAEHLG